ncbi:type IV secretion system protein [Paeniroseomonas aquatica]|uniref:Type IV secretion system protein n=1 Tax=Paeniroseomonas aquatica TaxID=373043 RepID=A0ABT7ZZW3_9PROT|nr:type IV secretion system protein [Paeniroseomonas aquatica]MDN3562999.1 type IV secretion system protein [Paeniroseomonas aquatica]
MALEGIFQSFATEFDATLVDGMNDVVRSGLAWAQPQLRVLLVLYVVAYALGFMLTANVSARQSAYAAVRGLLVAAAVQSAHYVPWVQEMFFTTLPNQTAAALNGPRITVSSAQQFDVMWSATLRVNAFVLQQASGWLQVMDRAMAWLFALICLVALSVMFIMWFVSRIFMAIVICMGPFLIPLYLFRATRGFVEGWIGKLVGLTVLQLASSILLRALLVVITARFSAMQNNLGSSIDMMLGSFAGIAGLFWMGALLMVVLPTAVSIGAAMGASQAATAAALLTLPGRASALAGRINRAVPRPGRA